ncbi:MAG: hypothetical protein IGQ88_02990 [Gloeomargaritaceae cyanobacterium C42_A2020_066]|nr:hypothetical protein [Gloeomargaritaceae cyanobacterium C42_A2020_066]
MIVHFLGLTVPLDAADIAGAGLWAVALSLGFSPLNQRLTEGLAQGLARLKPSRPGRPAGDFAPFDLVASLATGGLFLGIGALCNWAVDAGLGHSWAVSMGLMACVGCGVYELGRQDGERHREE